MENYIPKNHNISRLKDCQIISKGCSYQIVSVNNLASEILPIELVAVVREFHKVFPKIIPESLSTEKMIFV